MLSLRLATKDDAGEIGDFFRDLYSNSIYARSMDYESADVASLVETLAEDPEKGVTIMLLDDDRLVGAMICSSMLQIFNRSEKTAVEIAFWIKPEARNLTTMKKIMGAYRYWAKRTGCTSIMHGKLKNESSIESYTIRKLT